MIKTPRDILLHRHRTVEPRLDRIREQLLAGELAPRQTQRPPPAADLRQALARLLLQAWTELFWCCRRAWGGLAAAWVLIFALNLLSSESVPAGPTPARASSSAISAFFVAQKYLQAELDDSAPPVPRPPPPAVPQTRSERRGMKLPVA